MPRKENPKKELAKDLFLSGKTQKEISGHLQVSENTISKWAADGKWDKMKKSLTTTRAEQLQLLYDIWAKLNQEAKAALEDDDPNTKPDSDGISKITNAIFKLEKDVGVGEMIKTGLLLIKFVREEDLEAAKVINKWFYIFIQDAMSKIN